MFIAKIIPVNARFYYGQFVIYHGQYCLCCQTILGAPFAGISSSVNETSKDTSGCKKARHLSIKL